MKKKFGIEKLSIYPGQYYLNISDLAVARGLSAEKLESELLVQERSVFPAWEDAVTMAVNAADPMLNEEDRQSIGLLITATETSIDQEKTLSSWIHDALDLPDDCRNFEIKHACMGSTDAIRMALAWLETQGRRGQKALVISSDRSLIALDNPWESINGGAAAAILLSDEPKVLRYEGESGIYTQNITDVIRPTPKLETGNSQESLFGYLEALDGSLTQYLKLTPNAQDFNNYFAAHIYHTPFAGMTYRAHRCVLQNLEGSVSKEKSWSQFEEKILPALKYNRLVGTSFGASTFIVLTCMIYHSALVNKGDRISFYSYGAGSCGEFYSAVVGEDAVANIHGEALEAALNGRKRLSVAEYEAFERNIDSCIGIQNITHELDAAEVCVTRNKVYALSSIDNYVRTYQWIIA
jgi:3-hydroxy-3-methylglutaryl CoA synthase